MTHVHFSGASVASGSGALKGVGGLARNSTDQLDGLAAAIARTGAVISKFTPAGPDGMCVFALLTLVVRNGALIVLPAHHVREAAAAGRGAGQERVGGISRRLEPRPEQPTGVSAALVSGVVAMLDGGFAAIASNSIAGAPAQSKELPTISARITQQRDQYRQRTVGAGSTDAAASRASSSAAVAASAETASGGGRLRSSSAGSEPARSRTSNPSALESSLNATPSAFEGEAVGRDPPSERRPQLLAQATTGSRSWRGPSRTSQRGPPPASCQPDRARIR